MELTRQATGLVAASLTVRVIGGRHKVAAIACTIRDRPAQIQTALDVIAVSRSVLARRSGELSQMLVAGCLSLDQL